MQVLVAAQSTEPAGRELTLLLLHVRPQVQVGEEVGAGRSEPPVQRVCPLPRLERTLPRVLDRQRGRDDEHLLHAALARSLDHHASEPWVDRKAGQPTSRRGESRGLAATFEGAELLEQRDAVTQGAPVWRVDEAELLEVSQAEVGHLQDDRRQVRPQDLRIGEARPVVVVLLGVEPQADALGHAAAPARALVGRGL